MPNIRCNNTKWKVEAGQANGSYVPINGKRAIAKFINW